MEEKKSLTQDIRGEVKTGLVGCNTVIRAAIVSHLLSAEVDKREKAAIAVFEKLEAAELERRKIRPQFNGYNAEGVGQGEPVYNKEQTEQIKKVEEQITKLNKALETALEKNDFSKVFEVAGK